MKNYILGKKVDNMLIIYEIYDYDFITLIITSDQEIEVFGKTLPTRQ